MLEHLLVPRGNRAGPKSEGTNFHNEFYTEEFEAYKVYVSGGLGACCQENFHVIEASPFILAMLK